MAELKTLRQLVYDADRQFGEEIFISEYINKKYRNTTFAEFRRDCDSIAVWIQKHFTEKTHIALVGATSKEYLTASVMYPFRLIQITTLKILLTSLHAQTVKWSS